MEMALTSLESKRLNKLQYKEWIVKNTSVTLEDRYHYSENTDDYRCNDCHYNTKSFAYIRQHMITHSSSRPFACAKCGEKYKRINHLKRHIDIKHFGVKAYECTLCHKRVTQSNTLRDHIASHLMVGKQFVCPIDGCAKRFKIMPYLDDHQKRVHSNLTDVQLKRNASIEMRNQRLSQALTEKVCQEIGNLAHHSKKLRHQTNTDLVKVDVRNKSINSRKCEKLKEMDCEPTNNMAHHSKTVDNQTDTAFSGATNDEEPSVESPIGSLPKQLSCNIDGCTFRTKNFEDIANHFMDHWKIIFPDPNQTQA